MHAHAHMPEFKSVLVPMPCLRGYRTGISKVPILFIRFYANIKSGKFIFECLKTIHVNRCNYYAPKAVNLK